MPSLVDVESTAPDTDELAHFRERWKEEIRGRGQQGQVSSSVNVATRVQPAQLARASTAVTVSSRLKSAIETYAHAIAEEQGGNHPEATRLYRTAFRLDSNVDKAYHREEIARSRQHDFTLLPSLPINAANISSEDNKQSAPSQTSMTPQTLTSLVQSWPHTFTFTPENEAHGVPINKLPEELVTYILYMLALNMDTSTIERFAMVSRRARILSLDVSLWRRMVELTMVQPQLADPALTVEVLARRYHSDYRRLFIEYPRVRLDGVYISICHYVRNGLGENPWVTISHLITYRRFLRFLPSGEVLSYRANEDQDIVEVVHALQPGLFRKDLCVGNWQLIGTRVLVTNLAESSPRGHLGNDKYNFQMVLTLKSRPSLGRWNKLDILGHDSINIKTGEVCPFPLRHERPYWFSKVKSYSI